MTKFCRLKGHFFPTYKRITFINKVNLYPLHPPTLPRQSRSRSNHNNPHNNSLKQYSKDFSQLGLLKIWAHKVNVLESTLNEKNQTSTYLNRFKRENGYPASTNNYY